MTTTGGTNIYGDTNLNQFTSVGWIGGSQTLAAAAADRVSKSTNSVMVGQTLQLGSNSSFRIVFGSQNGGPFMDYIHEGIFHMGYDFGAADGTNIILSDVEQSISGMNLAGNANLTGITNVSAAVLLSGTKLGAVDISGGTNGVVSKIVGQRAGRAVVLASPYITMSGAYLASFHNHSVNSDGALAPSAVVTAIVARGISVGSVSDHNYLTPDPASGGTNFTYIPAIEETFWDSGRHMLHLFAQSVLYVTNTDIQTNIINAANAEPMGLIYANHPNWERAGTSTQSWSFAEIKKYHGFTGFEIWNTSPTGILGKAEALADQLCSMGNRMNFLGGEDQHYTPSGYGNQLLFMNNRTTQSVHDCLVSGNYIVLETNTSPIIYISTTGMTVVVTSCVPANIMFYKDNGVVAQSNAGVSYASYSVRGDEDYVRVVGVSTNGGKRTWANPIGVDLIESWDNWIRDTNITSQLPTGGSGTITGGGLINGTVTTNGGYLLFNYLGTNTSLISTSSPLYAVYSEPTYSTAVTLSRALGPYFTVSCTNTTTITLSDFTVGGSTQCTFNIVLAPGTNVPTFSPAVVWPEGGPFPPCETVVTRYDAVSNGVWRGYQL
jgi:hypothetical protein